MAGDVAKSYNYRKLWSGTKTATSEISYLRKPILAINLGIYHQGVGT